MLKISGVGWAEIKIGGEVVCEGSYLTEIPLDFLKALYDYFNRDEKDYLNRRYSSSVFVDLEGKAVNFVFSDMYDYSEDKVFMFYQKDNRKKWGIRSFSYDPYFLAKELIGDVENNIDAWSGWFADSYTEADKNHYKSMLLHWTEKLKKVIVNEKSYAEKLEDMNTPGTAENEQILDIVSRALKIFSEEPVQEEFFEHINSGPGANKDDNKK